MGGGFGAKEGAGMGGVVGGRDGGGDGAGDGADDGGGHRPDRQTRRAGRADGEHVMIGLFLARPLFGFQAKGRCSNGKNLGL